MDLYNPEAYYTQIVYTREGGSRQERAIFRSHPNYRKRGAWRDWCVYETEDASSALVGQIWAIFTSKKRKNRDAGQEHYLLVAAYAHSDDSANALSGGDRTLFIRDAVLPWSRLYFDCWKVISADSVTDTAYVLPFFSTLELDEDSLAELGTPDGLHDAVFWLDKSAYSQMQNF